MIVYPEDMIEKHNKSLLNFMEKTIANSTSYKSWDQITKSDDGYTEFANFLEKEFSTENILFVTEYVQLKAVMNQHDALRNVFISKELSYSLELPHSAPHSLISKTFTIDDADAVYSSTRKLFEKYIHSH